MDNKEKLKEVVASMIAWAAVVAIAAPVLLASCFLLSLYFRTLVVLVRFGWRLI